MTGQELVDCLEKTGTGQPKLDHARRFLEGKKDASAEEVYKALEEGLRRKDDGVCTSPGTLEKARKLMESGGAALTELLGKAPEGSDSDFHEKLRQTLAKAHKEAMEDIADKMADAHARGIGRPRKPTHEE